MSRKLPTPADLRELLDYDPETGALTWRERKPHAFSEGAVSAGVKAARWNARHSGMVAGTPHCRGYISIGINGVPHLAHRIAWAIYHGSWPDGEIDHINHDKTDNRIGNLRGVSHAENSRNHPPRKTNSTGRTGVYWYPRTARWRAAITRGGRAFHLGYFRNFHDAVAARKAAEAALGFHPNHGATT